MNRYSRVVTQPKDQGAGQVRLLPHLHPSLNIPAQAMLYATDGVTNDADFQKAMVGIGSVW